MTISIPAHTPVELNENLIPMGKGAAQSEETLRLNERELNNVFLIEPVPNQSYSETILQSIKTGVRLIVGQQTGEGKLNYLVCYTPPRRDSVAIEPLTANVDAFNNGEGLATLDPGGTLSGSMWVRLD
jgi:aldose 1-epimerase